MLDNIVCFFTQPYEGGGGGKAVPLPTGSKCVLCVSVHLKSHTGNRFLVLPLPPSSGPYSARQYCKMIFLSHSSTHICFCYSEFKGSVSRILRWVLLYINRRLSLRPIIASHKIVSLLKGQVAIYKKQAGPPLYCDMVSSR